MKKRIVSLLAAALCAASAAAMPANAAPPYYWGWVDADSPEVTEFFKDYEPLELDLDEKGMEWYENNGYDSFYYNKNNEKEYLFMGTWTRVELYGKDIDWDTLNAAVSKYAPEYRFTLARQDDTDLAYGKDVRHYTITLRKADPEVLGKFKAVCDELRATDKVVSCQCGNKLYWSEGYTAGHNILDYGYYEKNEIADQLKAYVEENNIDVTLDIMPLNERTGMDCYRDDAYSCMLIPNSEMSRQEQYDLAKKIYKDMGISYEINIPEVWCEPINFGSVEVAANVDGDANCDGVLSIADAAAVLQSLGNADKYALSAQGRFNADIDSNGISTADAVSIQTLCTQ